MTEEHKERIYQGVRRMVIQDEPRADVFHRLEVNGIDSVEAQQMYDRARAERIAIIRSGSPKNMALGLGLLFAGVGVLFGFSDSSGNMELPVVSLCVLAMVLGTWFFSKGLIYFFFAHTKEGSLVDEA